LTPKILLDYVNAGGNVLLGLSADSGTPSAISSLLLEFDIALSPDKNSYVVDHFNYDTVSAAEKHDVLLVNRPGQLRTDVTNFFGGEGVLAIPKPVGQTLGNASPLLSSILKAPMTAYAYNPKEEESSEEPFATGTQLAIISAMQARNSARFTVLGSLEMLQDKWIDASVKTPSGKSQKTVNKEFASQLTAWAFKEVGVLKVFSIQHHQIETSKKPSANTTAVGEYNPEIYRIKNDVVCMPS
jgi:oligosaccharyltransferase complex subunit beta